VTDTVWRIEKAKYAGELRTGEGARLVGGRWTSPGRPAVYCAQHLSLAVLEVLVHAPDPRQRLVPRVRVRVRIPVALVEEVAADRLPAGFSPRTPYSETQPIGDRWLGEARTAVLAVPNAIVPVERTLVLNPRHPDFDRIAWDRHSPIALDDRLWTTGRPPDTER
jgi:RES domain-containing protein